MATNGNIVPSNGAVSNGYIDTNNDNLNSYSNQYGDGPAAGNPNSTNGSAIGGVNPQVVSDNNGGWKYKWQGYGGNPLAHINTGTSSRLPAFGGDFQPGLYKKSKSNIANPAPLGLVAFAFTTFLLSLINWHTRNVAEPSIVIGAAFAYGGLVQLLAGMWEMAAGNTFGATALSSYGGFWISFAIVLTPGGFQIADSYTNPVDFNYALGFFLMGWFIFTFMLWICTLKSSLMFSALFFFLWLTFLLLGLSYLYTPNVTGGAQNVAMQKAGGMFGLLAAFAAWWNALAGIADRSNSFFLIPVCHFPWSEKGRKSRQEKLDDSESQRKSS